MANESLTGRPDYVRGILDTHGIEASPQQVQSITDAARGGRSGVIDQVRQNFPDADHEVIGEDLHDAHLEYEREMSVNQSVQEDSFISRHPYITGAGVLAAGALGAYYGAPLIATAWSGLESVLAGIPLNRMTDVIRSAAPLGPSVGPPPVMEVGSSFMG